MKIHGITMIGFGNVGQGFAQILAEKGESLAAEFGVVFRIMGVCDPRWGTVADSNGLDPNVLLRAVKEEGGFRRLKQAKPDWDSLRTIREAGASSVVELSPTDLATGEPAVSHVRAALESGQNAITTNKGPIALRYRELAELAERKGVSLGVEGTVMSGTPALRLGAELLKAAGIRAVRGIVNGTTNYILTRMQSDETYAAALADAQERGYAEADPTGDVEGYDAAGKLVILANVLLGADLKPADVDRTGITGLTAEDVTAAAERDECWKLIAGVERTAAGGFLARVRPERLPAAHPLASVRGACNAVTFTTELLGEVTLIGPGAGRVETGYAILLDLLAIESRRNLPA